MRQRKAARFLSLLLALSMLLSLGVSAAAEDAESAAAEDAESAASAYTVTFEVGEGATIDVYYTHDYTTADEINVTTAYARSSDTGEVDVTGDGQVNFLVNVAEGYELVSVTADANYKNLKGSTDTGVEDLYRLTKITGDVTVTVVTQKTEEASESGTAPTIDATKTAVDSETVWAYLDDGTDPADGYSDRTAWTLASYDISGWTTAVGPFGAKKGAVSDLGDGYDSYTLLQQYKADSTDDIEAYFFRTTVTIADASAVTAIVGEAIYDDSATVYINGVKVAGFDDSDITENLQYGGSHNGAPKTGDIALTDASVLSALKDGENVIAVEIHQANATSSDIYFDLSLAFSTDAVEIEQSSESSISISIGSDETERNFTWYATVGGEGILYLAKESDLVNGEMPFGAAKYTVTGTAATNKSGYYSYQTTVEGLAADTTYAYQLVNGETVSEIYTFTTGSGSSFSFALVGDPQIGAGSSTGSDTEGWEETLSKIGTTDVLSGVEFLLSVGDQVNTASDEEQYNGYLEHSALYSLTVATVIGNHDSGSVAYSEHFNITNESSYGTTSAGSDYYFVYNNVLFLVLNSNNTSAAEHEAFMKEAIAATADQDISWKIVTFHHSIYSVASHAVEDSILSRREALVPIFEELDIDVVLMGHDHVYCRTYMMDGLTVMDDASIYDDAKYSSITDPTGILYVTVNSGSGSKYYNIQTNIDFEYAAVMNQEKVPNISRVDVSDTQFTVTTYRTTDMSVVDTFTIYRTSETTEDGYGITVADAENGTVTVNAATAAAGETVTIAATPNEGYELASLTVTDAKGNEVTVAADGTFTMPESAVTVTAVFQAVETGSGSETVYEIAVTDAKNGTVTISPTSAAAGETVTIAATPDEGYELASLTVTDAKGNEVTVAEDGTFTMPEGAVTVTAVFQAAASASSGTGSSSGSDTSSTTTTTTPKTGDTSRILLSAVLAAFALAGLAGVGLSLRRRKKS